jgi:hypothetical protein
MDSSYSLTLSQKINLSKYFDKVLKVVEKINHTMPEGSDNGKRKQRLYSIIVKVCEGKYDYDDSLKNTEMSLFHRKNLYRHIEKLLKYGTFINEQKELEMQVLDKHESFVKQHRHLSKESEICVYDEDDETTVIETTVSEWECRGETFLYEIRKHLTETKHKTCRCIFEICETRLWY